MAGMPPWAKCAAEQAVAAEAAVPCRLAIPLARCCTAPTVIDCHLASPCQAEAAPRSGLGKVMCASSSASSLIKIELCVS